MSVSLEHITLIPLSPRSKDPRKRQFARIDSHDAARVKGLVDVDGHPLPEIAGRTIRPITWTLYIDADFRFPSAIRQWETPEGYRRQIAMPAFILDNPEGRIEHINGDGLDNRRSNLRVVPPGGKKAGVAGRTPTSARKGVYWDEALNAWGVGLLTPGTAFVEQLGHWSRIEEAIAVFHLAEMGENWEEFR